MALSGKLQVALGLVGLAVLITIIVVAIVMSRNSSSAGVEAEAGVEEEEEEEEDGQMQTVSAVEEPEPETVAPVTRPSIADTASVIAKFDNADILLNGKTYQLEAMPSASRPPEYDGNGNVTITGDSALRLTNATAPELSALATAFKSAYTVSVWMHSSNYNDSQWRQVFGFGASGTGRALGLAGWVEGSKWHLHQMWFNRDLSIDTPTSREAMQSSAGTPHMYTVSWSAATGVRKIYMDGVKVGQDSISGPEFASDVLYIGRYVNSTSGPLVNSTFADFRAWTTQLSDNDVNTMYMEGVL